MTGRIDAAATLASDTVRAYVARGAWSSISTSLRRGRLA